MRLCARRHAVLARRVMKAVPNEAVLVSIFYIRIDGPPKAHFTDGDNLPPTKGLSPTFTARYNTTIMILEKTLRWTVLASIFLLTLIPFYIAQSLFFPFITGKNFSFRILVEIMTAGWLPPAPPL